MGSRVGGRETSSFHLPLGANFDGEDREKEEFEKKKDGAELDDDAATAFKRHRSLERCPPF